MSDDRRQVMIGGPRAMHDEPLIRCRAVSKVFRTHRRERGVRGLVASFFRRRHVEIPALIDVDLTIHKGELVGLIGSNGAGKTTLVKCLTGIVPVSAGEATLFGRPSFELGDGEKSRLALVMGQRSQLWWDLPAIDSFQLLAEIYRVPRERFEERVHGFAASLEVADRLAIQLRHLSLGQRMKMEIIGAFLHDPEVVFLDEPTIGLDLVSRETIRQFLMRINRERGATVVLTSHDMEDIETTCRRLVILDAGRVLYDGDLLSLQQRVQGERAIEVHLAPGSRGWTSELTGELAPFGAALVRQGPSSLVFSVPAQRSRAFVQHLFDLFEVRDLEIERLPLEHLIREVFRTRRVGSSAPERESASFS